jgi:hypothetical protein
MHIHAYGMPEIMKPKRLRLDLLRRCKTALHDGVGWCSERV